MNCNLSCSHCVTKDFSPQTDLLITKQILDWINNSPFIVIVITGGEPLLTEYEDDLIRLLTQVKQKGLIVDTNGTILPSEKAINTFRDTDTLVRISWDSARPQDEIFFRHVKADTKRNLSHNLKFYEKKIGTIQYLHAQGINVAVQSVIHTHNKESIVNLIPLLHKYSIKQWYIQRFIPSYMASDSKFSLKYGEFDKVASRLNKLSGQYNIECIIKKDRRHNSVVQLIGEGLLYTQGNKPKEKIKLGEIGTEIKYFYRVSSADMRERYYV